MALKAGAVARLDDGARVVDGQIEFRVRPRSGTQFRVQVSHGEVRVVGTVFVVEQRAGGGFVSVSEGVIEFVWNDGARERVGAGHTVRWPREPKPEKPPPRASASEESEKPARADAGKRDAGKSAAAAQDVDQTMERLLQLRSQKRYAEAAALLEKSMGSGGLSPAQQERFSYELGLALEAGGSPACAHWQKHVKRFGSAVTGALWPAPRALPHRIEAARRCRARLVPGDDVVVPFGCAELSRSGRSSPDRVPADDRCCGCCAAARILRTSRLSGPGSIPARGKRATSAKRRGGEGRSGRHSTRGRRILRSTGTD